MPTPISTLADPAPLPDDLADAVVDRLQSRLVAPGLLSWAGMALAPAGQELPYAVVGEPDEADSSLDTSGDILADGHLTLACYAGTRKEARLLGDRVAGALQDRGLAFSAGTLVLLRQDSRTSALDPDPAPGGGDCWQEIRTFHYLYSYAYIPEGE